jgi:GT2 family glycosyltransferase/predicted SAM-dependent methyltransferase
MGASVDIIIPTWDNPQYLQAALASLTGNRVTEGLFHIYVVNNGHPKSCDGINSPQVTVLQAGENLGWEGGLKLGLEHSKAPFVCFFNDDAFIPPSSRLWLNTLLQSFRDERVGAVGPASNVVMGFQNIFAAAPYHRFTTKFLIGFCMLVRRSALDEVGGVDDSLPGGDDLDLSIRLRNAGYKLIVDRDVFVFHHGFKTGERVHGTADKAGGWNSYEFKDATDHALIKKHGLRAWYETMMGAYKLPEENQNVVEEHENIEGEVIAARVSGETILDLGCGPRKTVPNAIGVDMVATDETIDSLGGSPASVADIQSDVSKPLPFEQGSVDTIIARHILEHLMDPITVMQQWGSVLKAGGKLIVAVPDSARMVSIPMNIEHVHAWDKPAMKTLFETAGFTVTEQLDSGNHVSFITMGERRQSTGYVSDAAWEVHDATHRKATT